MNLFGFKVIVSEHCKTRKQFRFPRSGKRRIRAKWAKRDKNFKVTPAAFIAPEHTIYCHPSLYGKFTQLPTAAMGEKI